MLSLSKCVWALDNYQESMSKSRLFHNRRSYVGNIQGVRWQKISEGATCSNNDVIIDSKDNLYLVDCQFRLF